MTKCGKGCMPECEYFTTGGCISPFNCMYKIETGYINSTTSTLYNLTDLLIEFDEMGFASTTPCPDSEKYAIECREKVRTEFERLEAENAELTRKARQLELTLFLVVRNFKVLPVGLSLGKTQKEITDMTLETIEKIKQSIDYNSVENLFKEKKNEMPYM